MDVNHLFSFINLYLAFINMKTDLPTMILNMRKYLSLKNSYKYLLKSAIQKLVGQLRHCKSLKSGGGESKKTKPHEIRSGKQK